VYFRVRLIKPASIFPELSETELCKLLLAISLLLSFSFSLPHSRGETKPVRKQQERKRREEFIVCEYLLVSQRCGNDTSCIEFAEQTDPQSLTRVAPADSEAMANARSVCCSVSFVLLHRTVLFFTIINPRVRLSYR